SSLSPDLHQFMRDAASGEPFGTMFESPLVINHRPNKDGGLAFYFGAATAPDFVPNETATADMGIGRKPKSMIDVVGELVAEDERSEEHTSELQSRFDLVCRLLLEKKK